MIRRLSFLNLKHPIKFPVLLYDEENAFQKQADTWGQLLEALDEIETVSKNSSPLVSLIRLKIKLLTRK
jgi:hypothetical protein